MLVQKMTKKDIVKETARMIEQEKVFIAEVKNEQNPQVVELRHKAEGRVEALEDILLFANRRRRTINGKGKKHLPPVRGQ